MSTEDELTEAELLAELKAISMKSSQRFADVTTQKFIKVDNKVRSAGSDDKENRTTSECEKFLKHNGEDQSLNQYWYSSYSITALNEASRQSLREGGEDYVIAFLSTPSLYFALPEAERTKCFVLDYDEKWKDDRGFVFYDFNVPCGKEGSALEKLKGKCDMVVIDPPYITREVWEKYTKTAKFLLKDDDDSNPCGGRVLGTTVAENAGFVKELLGATPQVFRPSIPNLVYQYRSYCNFKCEALEKLNPEIDREEEKDI
jgi:hypothetical protein